MLDASWPVVALAALGLIVAFLASGMPVAVALGLAGLTIALLFLDNLGIVGYVAWELSNSFIMSAIPLFIFMGQLLFHSGVSKRLFEGSAALLGNVRGGLLQTNIAASALFATVSGSSVATAATIGAMALPELEKRGYDYRLTVGSLAAGGTLGILIPPSSALIIYGVIAEESIGALFVAGIIPGIILTFLFMAYIWLRAVANPELAPLPERESFGARALKVLGMWPIFVTMFVVLAGIYSGVMTPSEAAAVGSALALIFAVGFGRLSWAVLWDSLLGAVKASSMLLFIMIGAGILGSSLGLLRVPESLAEWVLSLNAHPLAILLAIYVMYVILGCFIDTVSMVVITVPFVLPIVTGLGYDPIWFGIVLVVLVEMAMITPPVGLNVYIIHGLRPDRPMSEAFAGALPFFFVMVLLIALLTAFPTVATWLPETMN